MSPPKHVDLLVLAAAAVVFVVCDFPMLGYATAAVAWLAQRGVQWLAQRRSTEALKAGNRQRAMGIIAATTLGRVWLMATIVLVVGILERTAGLSSAVLLAALFTISMGASGMAYLLHPEEQGVQPR
jgi:membrane glycosyltransferase